MKRKIKINLLAGSLAVFIVMLCVIVGFMVLSLFMHKYDVGVRTWKICMVSGLVLLVLDSVFFIIYIYKPVLKLRDAIRQLESAGTNGIMDLWASPDSMADSIKALLQELRLSMEREHGSELLRQQSQYAELQSQINPHFLYNTLETIRGQAIIDDNYKIADMTEALAKYFRYNISKDKSLVTLEQELENIKNYIHIQQYRFQDRFLFRVSPHVDYDEYSCCMIPKMTLQPIVENAIFHGMEKKLDMGHITIHIESTVDRLVLIVADDGVGMDEETLQRMNEKLYRPEIDMKSTKSSERHNGIAMENVNSRLRLLYGEDYGLRVSSTKDVGTEVEITLPKLKSGDRQVKV